MHYAWVVALVTFIVLLITAGVRATPGIVDGAARGRVRLEPRGDLGRRSPINIALFGLIGPFAASVMDRWGLRRVVLGALALLASAVALSTPHARPSGS